jgi:serine/threonine-protein kinase mTOR
MLMFVFYFGFFLPAGNNLAESSKASLVQVIDRVSAKLSGEDFPSSDGTTAELSVADQVQLLIEQASSHENLCQCYVGWCPFW